VSGLKSLQGARVVVTGAAKNIGLAIARSFLGEGAQVLLMDISEGDLAAAARSLSPGQAARALTRVADVRDAAAVQAAVTEAVNAWGGMDVVVSNAGIYPDNLVLDMAEEDWDRVMGINAKGTFLVCQAAARQMVRQGGGGHIITISSGSYKTGRVGSAHYCASKAAVVMFTQVLAMELAPHGIQVNSIAPGLVSSEHLDPHYVDVFTRSIPMGRVGQAEDIAAAVLTLAQSECTYLTGQTIGVDGGLAAGRYGLPLSHGDQGKGEQRP
jgi:NAD(P)-dependent dehydrogenase (short-subunit alcohol dehydrogenase family)